MIMNIKADIGAEEAFKIIDGQVDEHLKAVLLLKSQRNTYAPIARLPPELFTRIFEFSQQTDWPPSFYFDNGTEAEQMKWIKCSHVCRAWREIALNSPSLWRNIDIKFPNWVDKMLVRSKMADLRVRINTNRSNYGYDRLQPMLPIVQSVLEHGSRIQDLNLYGTQSLLEEFFPDLPNSAPRLQSLTITVKDRQSGSTLPKESFSRADRLKSMVIAGCSIDWAHHLSGKNALTILKLQDIPNVASISAPRFLEIFAQLSSLEVLDIKDACPIIEVTHAVQSGQRVSLPCLQELKLSCTPQQIEFILRHVDIPPETILGITSKGPSNASFSGILAAISSLLSLDEASKHLIRSLVVHNLSGLHISAYSCREEERIPPTIRVRNYGPTAPVLFLSLALDAAGMAERERLWKDVFSSLPLSNVVDTTVQGIYNLTCETLAESIGTLPHLTSLFLMVPFPDVARMLQVTQPHPSAESSLSPPRLAFSELRRLTLNQFIFDQYGGDLDVRDLLQSLIWRYECGAEVEKLDLSDCYKLTEDDVDLLREVVVDVDWDEVEQGFSDEEEDSEAYDDSYDEDYEDPYSYYDDFGFSW